MHALVVAIRSQAGPSVSEALAAISDVNELTPDGESALVACAAVGRQDLLAKLLESGGSADAQDSSGLSALAVAALNGNVSCITALLQAGATVDLRCGRSKATALINAAQNGNRGVCALLLEAGADPHLQDAYGVSAEAAAHRFESGSRMQVLCWVEGTRRSDVQD